jgi:ubiquinone/menaquinone biosynthesis C-methylase UbiE
LNTSSEVKAAEWEDSYGRRENFVFSPSDELVRFVARNLRRRVGLDEVIDVRPGAAGSRVLDVGCGVGRDLVFGTQMGLEMWGFDLSSRAVDIARQWMSRTTGQPAEDRVIACDICKLPWPDLFFDHAMSDSVIDSMTAEIAAAGIAEVARVLKRGGLFYCNLISGEGAAEVAGFAGEVVVAGDHERGTVQSYFNEAKARALLEPHFEVLGCVLHTQQDALRGTRAGRWHLTLRRR